MGSDACAYYPIRRGVELLTDEWDRNTRISYYAEQCRVDKSYFYKLFKARFGVSPNRYRTQLRLAAAKDMLLQRISASGRSLRASASRTLIISAASSRRSAECRSVGIGARTAYTRKAREPRAWYGESIDPQRAEQGDDEEKNKKRQAFIQACRTCQYRTKRSVFLGRKHSRRPGGFEPHQYKYTKNQQVE